jgi:hypothetical protein
MRYQFLLILSFIMLRSDRKIIDAEFIWESFGNYFWNIEQTIDMGVGRATWGRFFKWIEMKFIKINGFEKISKNFTFSTCSLWKISPKFLSINFSFVYTHKNNLNLFIFLFIYPLEIIVNDATAAFL